MAQKHPPSVRPPHRRTPREAGGLPALDDRRLYAPALREMLASDAYHVALIPRDEWDYIRGSQVEPSSTSPPVVLLLFSLQELVARVCEFVRDSSTLAERRIVRFGDVCIDFNKMEARRLSGELISLTAQEFKTLQCLVLNPDRVFSRSELLHEAWGYAHYPSTRTVDNHLLKLRQKLERDPTRPIHFQTVRGVGYKFAP